MVKVSFITIMARGDYPYLGRPELHLFEPTLESMKQQTMTDFEWIIIDVRYDERRDYFKNLELPFTVKHVPAKPNFFLENGYLGICAQYNKGIIYADGELLFFTGDGFMFTPNFMHDLWLQYLQGYFSLAWYMIDYTFNNPQTPQPFQSMDRVLHTTTTSQSDFPVTGEPGSLVINLKSTPIPYNILGYNGKEVVVEHRYTAVSSGEMHRAPWEWWFGCSSASLEAMLKINGFSQLFDGDKYLLDCDVGSRLEMAGYRESLVLFKNIFLTRALISSVTWAKGISIKCNLPLIYLSRAKTKNYRANVDKLTEEDIEWMKQTFCSKHCNIRELCKKEHPWQYPFEHKESEGRNCSRKHYEFWRNHQTIIDLSEEREQRLSGNKKYEEGTFTWAK